MIHYPYRETLTAGGDTQTPPDLPVYRTEPAQPAVRELAVCDWVPDGAEDPTQVHIVCEMTSGKAIVVRIAGPAVADWLIDTLRAHRDAVWPQTA